MTLNSTQVLNNLKKTFNAYVAAQLSGSTVNFDDDTFDTAGLDDWYAVRYTGQASESSGMGESIEAETSTEGRFHVVGCELSAWHRADPQRTSLGDMADKLVVITEAGSISLYDYADPENPVECGTLYFRPLKGTFTPKWGGGGRVTKSSSDSHTELDLVGFIVEMELITLAEVS